MLEDFDTFKLCRLRYLSNLDCDWVAGLAGRTYTFGKGLILSLLE